MAIDVIVTLERLNCRRESDGTGHSEPYLWPALVSIDQAFNVSITTPTSALARVVVKSDMRAGDIVAIPSSVGVHTARTESGFRALLLVVTLWGEDDFPQQAVTAGFEAFRDNLRAQIIDKLAVLGGMDEAAKEAAVEEIKKQVADRVESAISNKLSRFEKLTLNFDDVIGSDFKGIVNPSSGSIPISIGFNVGRLLFYDDASQSGGSDVSSPKVIGQGVWGQLKSVFSGGNGIIYAVDHPNSNSSDQFEIQGNLQVRPVVIDRCQAEINAVNAAQTAVNDILAKIKGLEDELKHASPAEKSLIIKEIKQIREEELPSAEAALEEARRALQACRG